MAAGRRATLLASAAGLLLLCAMGACAVRYEPSALHRSLSRNTGSANNLKTIEWLMRRGGKGGDMMDQPAYMLVKYEVPPALHDDFIQKWERHDKDLGDSRGLSFYQLSKDTSDNVYFWSYTEWDTCADLIDHMDSRTYTDFHDWVDKNDILVEAFPLEAVGDTKREYRYDREGEAAAKASRAAAARDLERRNRRRSDIEEWDPREEPSHTAIRFHIQPSMVGKFLDTFEKVQDRVLKDEDENRFYTLRKFVTMNHHYLLRCGWDSMDGFLDHITSGTCLSLKEFAKDTDTEMYMNTFRVLFEGTQ